MLDLAKIQFIAQSYSPQELFAALVWQRQFNEFNGEEVRILSRIAMQSLFPIGGIEAE